MSSDDKTNEFLKLISDPFSSQLQQDAFIASLVTSLGVTLAIALLFCFLRPFNTVVYAPRLKHADEKHAPPPIGKGLFAWVKPVWTSSEALLAERIGLDAVIFLRFTKMCRNMFGLLAVVGCAIVIPLNVVGGGHSGIDRKDVSAFLKMTPQFLFGEYYWGFIVCAYLFDIIVCGFLWWNYRAVARLRRTYFESSDYQNSLHSRTLMITDIPQPLRSDEGIVKITDEVKTTHTYPRAAIARNVKDIPDLIEEHEKAVRQLEKVLAKYLKNPDNLPATRPTCSPSKHDKEYAHKQKEKVDAIDYLQNRISTLEKEIKETRHTLDKRNAMPYGFASYRSIDDAHSVAYAARNKHPQGSTLRLAPKPNDIIWKNLPITPNARKWQKIYNNAWVVLLTIVWIVPNALIAVFLTNLSNLGKVWDGFKDELARNPKAWAAVQGILSPAVTSLVYYYLPVMFRRLSIRAGDQTKTSRERHVVNKLYAFFCFNNLFVFSLFAAGWGLIAAVIDAKQRGGGNILEILDKEKPTVKIMEALCQVSPFWITWLLQRNLGAAVDLSQVVNLAWGGIRRKFGSPTPREMIEWTAPPPFDYANYYNYFLFYSTVALCFGTLQPVILPVAALYFFIDSALKKYLLMYVFVTKTESGGQFWRVLFNRFIFAMIASNCVIALMVAAKGLRATQLPALIPLPVLLAGFKWYCARTFDDGMHYFNHNRGAGGPEHSALPDKESRHGDRVSVRFGHPALYKKLMTPMVHEKAKHRLNELYRGRLDHDDSASVAGYSDVFTMQNLSREGKTKKSDSSAPFEIVSEAQIDFENYKNRPDFREEFGGDGEVYGRPSDMVRPGTPSSVGGRSTSRDTDSLYGSDDGTGQGTTYPAGYHTTPNARNFSPDNRAFGPPSNASLPGATPYGGGEQDYGLLRGAAPMGAGSRPGTPSGGPAPYAQTPGQEGDTGYDYFRGRTR